MVLFYFILYIFLSRNLTQMWEEEIGINQSLCMGGNFVCRSPATSSRDLNLHFIRRSTILPIKICILSSPIRTVFCFQSDWLTTHWRRTSARHFRAKGRPAQRIRISKHYWSCLRAFICIKLNHNLIDLLGTLRPSISYDCQSDQSFRCDWHLNLFVFFFSPSSVM